MPVKLHRCGGTGSRARIRAGKCNALEESGTEYEVVTGPLRRGRRDGIQALTGQRLYPAIEFEDGSAYREQSKDMVATVRAGKLIEKAGSRPP